MTRTTRALMACTLMIVAALAAGPAFAASIGWASVDLVLHDDATPMLIVSAQLPQDASLPVDVSLAVPAGAQVQWAGEVLGGPLEQDPTRVPSVVTSGTMDLQSFTVSEGYRAQVEALVPGAILMNDGVKVAALSWTAPQDIPVVNAMIRLPAGSEIATMTPGATIAPGPTGFQYLERSFTDVAAGDLLELSITYTPPAGAAAGAPVSGTGAQGNSTSDALIPLLFIAAALGVAAMMFMSVKRKMSPSTAEETEVDSDSSAAAGGGVTVAADDAGDAEPARTTLPIGVITAIVAVVFVVGAAVAINLGTQPQVSNGTISAQIATVNECTRSTFSLAIPDGTSIEKASEEIFDALRMTTGIGLVTVYTDDPRVEVGYCESSNNEPAIRQVLTTTGYLAAP